jgi:hypothetical protein
MDRAYKYRKVIILSLMFILSSISITPVFGFTYIQNTSLNKLDYISNQEYPLIEARRIIASSSDILINCGGGRGYS